MTVGEENLSGSENVGDSNVSAADNGVPVSTPDEDSQRVTSPLQVERKTSGSGVFIMGGCFLTFIIGLLILIGAFFGFFYFTYHVAKKPVEFVAQSMRNAAEETWRIGREAINKAPESAYSVRYQFLSSGAADKYIIAEISENVTESFESTKWNVLSGKVTLQARATFEYYIPLSRYKYIVKNSPYQDKYDFEFIFEDLSLNTPVKREISKMKVSQSRFSVDVNDSLDRYIAAEFPTLLVERGMDFRNMELARDIAEKSMEKYVRETVFPLMGIRPDEVNQVEIIFSSREVETAASAVGIGGPPVPPPTAQRSLTGQ